MASFYYKRTNSEEALNTLGDLTDSMIATVSAVKKSRSKSNLHDSNDIDHGSKSGTYSTANSKNDYGGWFGF